MNIRRCLMLLSGLYFLVASALPVSAHNVYASFSSIEWNADDKSVELVIQVHAHELEARLSLDAGKRMTFLEEADYPVLEAAAGPLAKANLALEVDGAFIDLTYLGMELEGQTVYFYLEANLPQPPKTVTFMNSLFLDDLPDQTNTVMGVVAGVRRAGEIRAGTGPAKLEF